MSFPNVWSDADHPGWLDLSARAQREVNRLSGRTDVVTVITPDAAAVLDWRTGDATATIGARLVLDEPADHPLSVRADEAHWPEWPDLGATLIETVGLARHAGHPLPEELSAQVSTWVESLDRVRVQAAQIAERPGDRLWLRIANARRHARPLSMERGLRPAVEIIGLAIAGALSERETARLRHRLVAALDHAQVHFVEESLRRVCALSPDDREQLIALANRLHLLVDGTDGDEKDLDDDIGAWAREARQAALDQLEGEAGPRGSGAENLRQRDSFARENSQVTAELVTHRPDDIEHVEPDEATRRLARDLSRRIREAQERPSTLVRVLSRTPPGQLIMPQLLRRAGQVAVGALPTATPWSQLRRRPPEEPRLTLGLSWDISRSRHRRHAELCAMSWALGRAVRQVGGRFAAVAFNDRAWPVVIPDRAPDLVATPACSGGSAGCPESVRALDGMLALSWGQGPRVLVVNSDGRLPNRRHAASEVDALISAGVHVLWVGEGAWSPPGSVLVDGTADDAAFHLIAHVTRILGTAR